MGTNVSEYIKKRGSNPFAGAVSRNAEGALTVDLGRVLDTVGVAATNRQQVNDLTAALGRGPVSVDALRDYRATYRQTTGGDADMAYDSVWSPTGNRFAEQALDSAIEAFNIRERGEQDAARIAQDGRDEARQSNFGAELATAQRRSLAASEDQAQAGSSATPDVVLDSGVEDGGEAATAGNGNTRRRRQAFSGAGLRI